MANRTCPYCKKQIHHKATACPYCTKTVEAVSFWKTRLGCIAIPILFFVGLAIIGMLLGGPSETPEPATTGIMKTKPSPSAPFNVGQKVVVSGVENGVLEVPRPNLWQQPGGGGVSGQKVRTQVKSGTSVKITGSRYVSPRWFFHIETYGANKGKNGWISELFIKP